MQGFEIGSGFSGARMTGSEHNDPFYMDNGKVRTRTNRSGGIQVRGADTQLYLKPQMRAAEQQLNMMLAFQCVHTRTNRSGGIQVCAADKQWTGSCS
jgi:chorismate synthase